MSSQDEATSESPNAPETPQKRRRGRPPGKRPPNPKASNPEAHKRSDLYTPEIARQIVERLSEGETLRAICRSPGMPAWRYIYDWMLRDADLHAAIARAREVGQDAIAEQTLDIIDELPSQINYEQGVRYDSAYVQWQKNRVELRLKLLAKWNPKRYGDKVSVGGDAENPLNVKVDTTVFDSILENLERKRQAKGE